ncbi:MAG: 30S ribosome-binding factor RbfA [Magnetococcus sp. DMHC-1]|nr:30S ribosome-binding factor RbfA [Magnetococcales bacterium]
MSVRTERVRVQIRREIAAMLERGEVKDPRLTGLISISDVEVSRDLSYATVFYSILGPAEADEKSCEALNHATGFIRSRLARRLKLRQIPILRFVKDTSFEYGNQMDRLLQSLHIPAPEEEK